MNREYHQDLEYNQQRQDHEAGVRYSAEWMKPSRHVYQRRRIGLFARLIRWIAGH